MFTEPEQQNQISYLNFSRSKVKMRKSCQDFMIFCLDGFEDLLHVLGSGWGSTSSVSDCLSNRTWDLLTLHSFLFFLEIRLSSSERDKTDILRWLLIGQQDFVSNQVMESKVSQVHIFTFIRWHLLLTSYPSTEVDWGHLWNYMRGMWTFSSKFWL